MKTEHSSLVFVAVVALVAIVSVVAMIQGSITLPGANLAGEARLFKAPQAVLAFLDATVVSFDAPSSLAPGERATVSLTFRNTGRQAWDPERVSLAFNPAQAEYHGSLWGVGQVSLDERVEPGEEHAFSWQVTAPSRAGTYPFRWQLVAGANRPFGEAAAGFVEVGDGPPAPPPAQECGRIGTRLRQGTWEFYCTGNGHPFVARGHNLVRLEEIPHQYLGSTRSHATFDPLHYNHGQEAAALASMAADGYNVVRVFLVPRRMTQNGSLNTVYLDNLADFLLLAEQHDIYVYPTFSHWWMDGYPVSRTPDIEKENAFYLVQGSIDTRADFTQDVLYGLLSRGAPLERIFAWDLINEIALKEDQLPLSLTTGFVQTATGSYHMAEPEERYAMMTEGLAHYVDEMRAAIRAVDPQALVSVSFFQPAAVDGSDMRIVPRARDVYDLAEEDFGDQHAYVKDRNYADFVDLVASTGMDTYADGPFVMGEFGVRHEDYPLEQGAAFAAKRWQAWSCALGYDAWFFWSWVEASPAQAWLWHATEGAGLIDRALAPSNRPDPCAQ